MRKHTSITIAAAACALAIGGTATAAVTAAGTPAGTAGTTAGAAPAPALPNAFPKLEHAGLYYIRHVSPDDPPSTVECQSLLQINCYDPAQVEQAYNLTSLYDRGVTGKGRTIALIDVFGSPGRLPTRWSPPSAAPRST